MPKNICILLLLLISLSPYSWSQSEPKPSYQGLLWEITGNSLEKPSYLFGTMHVSSKVAFHLGDAFYSSIRKVDMIALEINPDSLQEDYLTSVFFNARSGGAGQGQSHQSFDGNTFTINDHKEKFKTALTYNPELVNMLLYRSYATEQDFEENTFLDLYIYQVGKKLGKLATGVEDFEESEKLVVEGYREMMKEQSEGKFNYDYDLDGVDITQALTSAYRRGDLDLIDSLSTRQYRSKAFLEKFLYQRNENMFHAIDSIIQTSSLFAGVGAAHLPGERGLINILRAAGYTVTAMKMGQRDSQQKDEIEKIKVEKSFAAYQADDGAFEVHLPGKLYDFGGSPGFYQRQYADLANGTYYLVSRIKTRSSFLGVSEDKVMQGIDSLLYENIPGKILSKTDINKNGYPGFDIVNRSRRGDLQRYQIFATPFEVFIFKMSGNGDYVDGKEGDQFFNSIALKENPKTQWHRYDSRSGGFSISLPHTPLVYEAAIFGGQGSRTEWIAEDRKTGNNFMVIKKTLLDYNHLEEDTTLLGFAEESFLSSDFIKTSTARKWITIDGYPGLEVASKTKNGTHNLTRFILRGPQFYILSADYQKQSKDVTAFMDSFSLIPYQYPKVTDYENEQMLFSVKTPEGTAPERGLLDDMYYSYADLNLGERTNYSEVFYSDVTNEQVVVEADKMHKYYYVESPEVYWEKIINQWEESENLVLYQKMQPDPNTLFIQLRDTNSSQSIHQKYVLHHDRLFTLASVSDTIQGPSSFVTTFFSSFNPADTVLGVSLFLSKVDSFWLDLNSTDEKVQKTAVQALNSIDFKDTDAPFIIRAINQLSSKPNNYLNKKSGFIRCLGGLDHPTILPYLTEAYRTSNDTTSLQNALLTSLLQQKTLSAYQAFKEIVLAETPIFNQSSDIYQLFSWMEDSLELSRQLFPELLRLTSLSDYQDPIYELMATLVRASKLDTTSYHRYLNQILYHAKIESKRQFAKEEENDQNDAEYDYQYYDSDNDWQINYALTRYAYLLAPYLSSDEKVKKFFDRLMYSQNIALLTDITSILLSEGQAIPDTLVTHIVALDRNRMQLYHALKEINRLEEIPEEYRSQEALSRSLLYANESYGIKIDSLVHLKNYVTGYQLKKGKVFVYKYQKEKSDIWYLAFSGLQPIYGEETDLEATFVGLTDEKYTSKKTLDKKMAKILKRKKLGNWEVQNYYPYGEYY